MRETPKVGRWSRAEWVRVRRTVVARAMHCCAVPWEVQRERERGAEITEKKEIKSVVLS